MGFRHYLRDRIISNVWYGSNVNKKTSQVIASGGTEINSNGYKIHVFVSPGTFSVSYPGDVEYLVVAGGGTSGGITPTPPISTGTGGGGAGGIRTGTINLSIGSYSITVGAAGSPSIFSNITSTRGGDGGAASPFGQNRASGNPGSPGGCGGGGGAVRAEVPPFGPAFPTFVTSLGGSGNTPPTSPPQGGSGGSYTVGPGLAYLAGGGGGGGSGSGGNAAPPTTGGAGGAGLNVPWASSPIISPAIPSPVLPTWSPSVGSNGTYSKGGAGGSPTVTPSVGATNTGNGGQGNDPAPTYASKSGGSGIVILRYLF